MLRSDLTDCSYLLAAAADDNRPYAVSESSVRTRAELALAAAGWKKTFEESGARSVGLYFTDIFDSAAALLGCWAAGVRAVLPADTSEALTARLAENVQALAGEFSAPGALPVLTRAEASDPCRTVLDPSRQLVALFTSGSTGEPALVVKRLSQLFCEVESIGMNGHGRSEPLPEDTVIFPTVSQQHIYGLLFALLWPLYTGRAVWHSRILYPEELLGHLVQFQNAVWVASPAHLNRLPEHPLWEKAGPILRAVYSSGGPLSEEGLRLTIDRTGQSPIELFGSSESGGIAARQRSVSEDGRVVDPGFRALPGTELKVVDSILFVKSPQLASDTWEETTDRVELAEDGLSIRLLGRVDRIVKIEGKRVSLTAVEKALVETGLIASAKAFMRKSGAQTDAERIAVAAVPTPEGAQLLVAEGKKGLVTHLRQALLRTMERVCLPRQWRFAAELPQNAMSKVTVESLETLFDARTPQIVVLERPSATSVTAAVVVAGDSPYFEGHFPGFSLLPGVVQVQWAQKAAGQLLCLRGALCGVKTLKFTAPIRPGTTVLLRLERTAAGASFVYESTEGKILSRGTLVTEAS